MIRETEQGVRDVTFMIDPKPRYVSLVKRGANQTPFRVVKHEKEYSMRVLQSIVAFAGTDVEAIKSAVGHDVSEALRLTDPVMAGKFVTYEQAPREAFKSDSFTVVSLNDDKTLLAVQGELIEETEGIVAKIFKPMKKTAYIQMASDEPELQQEVLKSQLSNLMWEELNALDGAVRGILTQEEGSGSQKLTMIKTILDNFLAAVETSIVALKCDKFDLPDAKEVTVSKSEALAETQAASGEQSAGAEGADEEPSQEEQEPANEEAKPVADASELAEQVVAKAVAAMKDQLQSLTSSLEAVREDVNKMQKTPAVPVVPSTDDGVVPVQKTDKTDNVFAGCFGRMLPR